MTHEEDERRRAEAAAATEARLARIENALEALVQCEVAAIRLANWKNAIPGYEQLEVFPMGFVPFMKRGDQMLARVA